MTTTNSHNAPLVTVLMPVYNAEAYVAEAIESILVQTHKDFTFLILDDGSTDGTLEIVRSYDDPRIRLIAGDANLGITRRLNQGLELCAGELVARMDADDLSHPWRLASQVAYLSANPSCAMVATGARLIDAEGKYLGPYDPWGADPYFALNFDCYICHPSVMMRKSCVMDAGGYLMDYAEDFDLWWRLSRAHPIHVMKEPLLSYRLHADNLSHVRRNTEYRKAETMIRQRNFRYLLGTEAEVPDSWAACYNGEFGPILQKKDPGEIIACLDLLDRVADATVATENPNRNTGVIRYFAAAKKTHTLRATGDRLPLAAMLRLTFHYRRYGLATELCARKVQRFIHRKKDRSPARGAEPVS
jgi:glycosyltransferase involved in cell wall biosynthesis